MKRDPGRYVEVIVAKGATILSCQDCGAVVLHRTTHDAWHKAIDDDRRPRRQRGFIDRPSLRKRP